MKDEESRTKDPGAERTVAREISWCDGAGGASTCTVDAKDSKIVRIRPARHSSFLAELEKTDMEALRAKYPEAFARPFHPCAGPGLEACIMGGE